MICWSKEAQGWGSVWEQRMTIGQAALDDAYKLAAQGKVNEALDMVNRIIADNPNNWRAHFLKAAVLVLAERRDDALREMDQSIRLAHHSNVSAALLSELYQSKGRSCIDYGRYQDAKRALETAVHLQPNDPTTLNDLAWMFATAQNKQVRNGRRAVSLATKACRLGGWTNAFAIDTLAAAYAESGRFDEAARYEQLAMQNLRPEDRKEQLGGMQNRLQLYESGQPYRGQ
ncbi:MAG: tetratricopeptide repeat protein [Verrucomicrobia bacterium]|nr:tetratricopeptide repeat protein [Verrucomicrobiota bacterium]